LVQSCSQRIGRNAVLGAPIDCGLNELFDHEETEIKYRPGRDTMEIPTAQKMRGNADSFDGDGPFFKEESRNCHL
jgi:hypothetical protein